MFGKVFVQFGREIYQESIPTNLHEGGAKRAARCVKNGIWEVLMLIVIVNNQITLEMKEFVVEQCTINPKSPRDC